MDDFDLATEERLDALADRLWTKIVGVHFNPIELHLRAKLALEHHLLGSTTPSFGLDKMSAAETAAYYSEFGLTSQPDGWFATRDGGPQLRIVPSPMRRLVELHVGADDSEERVERRCDGALLEIGGERSP